MLKASCTLYRFSKKRLIVLFELKKKKISSDLTDSNLVEYSTSKLKTHIRKKNYPSQWDVQKLSLGFRIGELCSCQIGCGTKRTEVLSRALQIQQATHRFERNSASTWTYGQLSKHLISRHFKLSDFLLTYTGDFLPSKPVLLLHRMSESFPPIQSL